MTNSSYVLGMPGLSNEEDIIEVEFFERESGGTQMFFYYQSYMVPSIIFCLPFLLSTIRYLPPSWTSASNDLFVRFDVINHCLRKRTNKSFEADVQEGGKYRIVDSRNGKQNIIEGTYEELVLLSF
jgi:hypothetical protein